MEPTTAQEEKKKKIKQAETFKKANGRGESKKKRMKSQPELAFSK